MHEESFSLECCKEQESILCMDLSGLPLPGGEEEEEKRQVLFWLVGMSAEEGGAQTCGEMTLSSVRNTSR